MDSALRRRVEARRAATESDPSKRTVAHTVKGLPRLAHAPKDAAVLRRPIIAPEAIGASKVRLIRNKFL